MSMSLHFNEFSLRPRLHQIWRPVAVLRAVGIAAMALLIAGILMQPAHGASRIKDIVNIEGVRDNLLVGYGLVVGLNGIHDTYST